MFVVSINLNSISALNNCALTVLRKFQFPGDLVGEFRSNGIQPGSDSGFTFVPACASGLLSFSDSRSSD